ncbi:short-chain dehydrogenase/reductase [Streptomyces sp. NPDC058914]|uniref:short-chain dehydrogenase/reductase n=1 Tax=Streptomyces TaxID=1883 RepID=UPI0036A70D40
MTRTSVLRGRTAVVTGAARGLGAALGRALVLRGARVALLGLEGDELARVAASLPDGAAVHRVVDVTDEAGLADAAAWTERRLGTPSVVVANAGVAEAGPFGRCDPRVWRRIVEVNLVGSANTARAFLPGLLATRGYHLQIASSAALAPAPLLSAYCASKSGVEAFAHVLRTEVGPRGVGVGVAYLSWAETGMTEDADRHHALRRIKAGMPWPGSKLYPVDPVAARLADGIERRAAHVYGQPWLRAVRVLRPLLPGAVAWHSRHSGGPGRLEDIEPTGLLGSGGGAAAGPVR